MKNDRKEAMEYFENLRKKIEKAEIEKYGRLLTEEEHRELDEERERKLMEEKKKERQQEAFAKFVYSIPPRYKSSTFEKFEGYEDKIEFLKQGKSAVLFGGNGTGKTHLGYACCRHFVEQGLTVKFVLAYKFFEAIKNSFDNGDTSSVLNDFAKYDYLVIDEIDKAYGSQFEFIHLYHLVNERYNFMRPTILITNAKKEGLMELLGASVLDRIASEGAIIEMAGENYRQKK